MPAEIPRDRARLQQWQAMVRKADRYNILCHCQHCGSEWVTSDRRTVPCSQCASLQVERIACWQFPDG